jgi:hypothetical protein
VTSKEPSRRTELIEQPIMECRDQLIRKFCNQANFFVEELKQPPAADMALDAREQSAGLVSDIIVAARADKPNGLTLASLLKGLGMAVQAVASVRPAWDAVRALAIAMHVPVP